MIDPGAFWIRSGGHVEEEIERPSQKHSNCDFNCANNHILIENRGLLVRGGVHHWHKYFISVNAVGVGVVAAV